MKKSFVVKSLIALTCLIIIGITRFLILQSSESVGSTSPEQLITNDSQVEPLNITKSIIRQAVSDKIYALKEEEIQYKVYRIESLLENYNSPMKGLGRLMYDRATECGGDYRIIVAIAGNESGFGRIPYRQYNPFGYLDGVNYNGFEEAVNILSCRIAERFLKPCSNDLTCIINKYGGSDTDKPKWISNITYFMNLL